MTKKRKKKSGSTRMREQGYKQMSLWLSPLEVRAIREAAHEKRLLPAVWARLALGVFVRSNQFFVDIPKKKE